MGGAASSLELRIRARTSGKLAGSSPLPPSATRLILANPDLLYPRDSSSFGVAAGAVAAMIEATLLLRDPSGANRFVPLGKPYALMFEAAIRRVPGQDVGEL